MELTKNFGQLSVTDNIVWTERNYDDDMMRSAFFTSASSHSSREGIPCGVIKTDTGYKIGFETEEDRETMMALIDDSVTQEATNISARMTAVAATMGYAPDEAGDKLVKVSGSAGAGNKPDLGTPGGMG